jgi:poly(3-hydroxyalkanoate) synthetase
MSVYDLAAAPSSVSLNDAVSSNDKTVIEFPVGHVGLCVSSSAYKAVTTGS